MKLVFHAWLQLDRLRVLALYALHVGSVIVAFQASTMSGVLTVVGYVVGYIIVPLRLLIPAFWLLKLWRVQTHLAWYPTFSTYAWPFIILVFMVNIAMSRLLAGTEAGEEYQAFLAEQAFKKFTRIAGSRDDWPNRDP